MAVVFGGEGFPGGVVAGESGDEAGIWDLCDGCRVELRDHSCSYDGESDLFHVRDMVFGERVKSFRGHLFWRPLRRDDLFTDTTWGSMVPASGSALGDGFDDFADGRPGVLAEGAVEAVVCELFEDVSGPAGGA